jgi:YgiT-type zinc finger domain-containing protein
MSDDMTTCPECGALMKPSTDKLSYPAGGTHVYVEGIEHLRCTECLEVLLTIDQAKELREKAIAASNRE